MKEILGVYYDSYKIPVGSKIKFKNNKNRFTVRASNIMFSICTQGKYYCIIDWYQNIRGAENLIFGMGVVSNKECEGMLERLTQGESEISNRNQIELELEKIEWKDYLTLRG